MAKTSEQLLQELLDREAIRDLPIRYCHCVWQRDVDGIVDLFTEEGSINLAGPDRPPTKGRANLLDVYKRALDDLRPRPFIHNHVVELQGPDRARGTCYVEIRAVRDGESVIGAGHYEDEYVKVGDEWKFRSRDVSMHYMVPLNEGWADALGDSA